MSRTLPIVAGGLVATLALAQAGLANDSSAEKAAGGLVMSAM